MRSVSAFLSLLPFFFAAASVAADDETASETMPPGARQVSTHMGEMTMPVELSEAMDFEIDDALRFEPYQQLEEMFARDDVVYLMRHGPTDWSKLDEKAVAPTDCGGQRVMVEEGRAAMRDLGTLMAANDILPARIVTSQWCRNQQTVEALLEGIARVDADVADAMPVETTDELNLLLSLQGSTDVDGLRERVSSWDGDAERAGPLLIVTHYTNIEELTQFRVFEGEILVIDPDRDNQVLGYLRLKSAAPDVGHFADALASPLLGRAQAFDMVERYYAALADGANDALGEIVADDWVMHGPSPSKPDRDMVAFRADLAGRMEGFEDVTFTVGDVHVADDVVTVLGTIHARHTGAFQGIAPTGREVAVGAIAVHRVEYGAIAETWQMVDRATLHAALTEAAPSPSRGAATD